MKREELLPMIEAAAAKEGINPKIVEAIVMAESGGNEMAIRFEGQYIYLHTPEAHAARLGSTIETEKTLQKFSWGLMQPMGAVLREYGFLPPLPMALAPEVSLQYGVKHFRKFLEKYNDLEKAVSCYNAGSIMKDSMGRFRNYKYVEKVMSGYKSLG